MDDRCRYGCIVLKVGSVWEFISFVKSDSYCDARKVLVHAPDSVGPRQDRVSAFKSNGQADYSSRR